MMKINSILIILAVTTYQCSLSAEELDKSTFLAQIETEAYSQLAEVLPTLTPAELAKVRQKIINISINPDLAGECKTFGNIGYSVTEDLTIDINICLVHIDIVMMGMLGNKYLHTKAYDKYLGVNSQKWHEIYFDFFITFVERIAIMHAKYLLEGIITTDYCPGYVLAWHIFEDIEYQKCSDVDLTTMKRINNDFINSVFYSGINADIAEKTQMMVYIVKRYRSLVIRYVIAHEIGHFLYEEISFSKKEKAELLKSFTENFSKKYNVEVNISENELDGYLSDTLLGIELQADWYALNTFSFHDSFLIASSLFGVWGGYSSLVNLGVPTIDHIHGRMAAISNTVGCRFENAVEETTDSELNRSLEEENLARIRDAMVKLGPICNF